LNLKDKYSSLLDKDITMHQDVAKKIKILLDSRLTLYHRRIH